MLDKMQKFVMPKQPQPRENPKFDSRLSFQFPVETEQWGYAFIPKADAAVQASSSSAAASPQTHNPFDILE
jgi:hypothetical protein